MIMGNYFKKCAFLFSAVLLTATAVSCGHDEFADDVSETAENTSAVSGAEISSENIYSPVDTSEIPDGAAYKCTEYLVLSGTPSVSSISYCDEYGYKIRKCTYLGDEMVSVINVENEYDSERRLILVKEKTDALNENADSSESFVEFEYYENGDMKQMSICESDQAPTTVEWTYEYDEQGRPVVKYEYWDGSDELFSTTYITYDENGNAVKEKINYKGKKEIESTYQYDEKGRVVKDESSLSKSSFFIEYEYEDYKDFTVTRPNGLTY